MNNKKSNYRSKQQSSVAAAQQNKNSQLGTNDDLAVAEKKKLNLPFESDNPSFVLGYN